MNAIGVFVKITLHSVGGAVLLALVHVRNSTTTARMEETIITTKKGRTINGGIIVENKLNPFDKKQFDWSECSSAGQEEKNTQDRGQHSHALAILAGQNLATAAKSSTIPIAVRFHEPQIFSPRSNYAQISIAFIRFCISNHSPRRRGGLEGTAPTSKRFLSARANEPLYQSTRWN